MSANVVDIALSSCRAVAGHVAKIWQHSVFMEIMGGPGGHELSTFPNSWRSRADPVHDHAKKHVINLDVEPQPAFH